MGNVIIDTIHLLPIVFSAFTELIREGNNKRIIALDIVLRFQAFLQGLRISQQLGTCLNIILVISGLPEIQASAAHKDDVVSIGNTASQRLILYCQVIELSFIHKPGKLDLERITCTVEVPDYSLRLAFRENDIITSFCVRIEDNSVS